MPALCCAAQGGGEACIPCGSGGGAGGEAKHNVTLSYSEIFFLATLGGAHVLNLEDKIGNFVVGKEFDALVVDASAPGSNIEVYDHDQIGDHFQKFLTLGDDRNIQSVFVRGRKVR